jgi:hypothetical protein
LVPIYAIFKLSSFEKRIFHCKKQTIAADFKFLYYEKEKDFVFSQISTKSRLSSDQVIGSEIIGDLYQNL